ncbi:hypothetical protein [Algoriphagus sp. A40]|uniref:hypothetical protein n=1 Tax=Algoriphagus sp. A40 TaxID=1945863 RepID=UPI0014394756|nr:hypothetical protein [Algoriphagus sp. A40]
MKKKGLFGNDLFCSSADKVESGEIYWENWTKIKKEKALHEQDLFKPNGFIIQVIY